MAVSINVDKLLSKRYYSLDPIYVWCYLWESAQQGNILRLNIYQKLLTMQDRFQEGEWKFTKSYLSRRKCSKPEWADGCTYL